MIVSVKTSILTFLAFFLLGITLAILSKVLIFAFNKFIAILFPVNKQKNTKINLSVIVNLIVASLVFGIYTFLSILLSLYLNYGIFRLYMIISSLLGFYLTYKILSLKFKFKKSRNKTA